MEFPSCTHLPQLLEQHDNNNIQNLCSQHPEHGAPCAVRQIGYFDLFPRMARVTAVTPVSPDTGLLRFLLSPKIRGGNARAVRAVRHAVRSFSTCAYNLFFPLVLFSAPHHFQPKYEEEQTIFTTKNTRLLSVLLLNLLFLLLLLLCGRMLPRWWGVFRVATGKPTYHWALCPRCAETPPNTAGHLTHAHGSTADTPEITLRPFRPWEEWVLGSL